MSCLVNFSINRPDFKADPDGHTYDQRDCCGSVLKMGSDSRNRHTGGDEKKDYPLTHFAQLYSHVNQYLEHHFPFSVSSDSSTQSSRKEQGLE